MTTAATDSIDVSGVADFMRPAMRDYAGLIQNLAGDNLAGLTAYGPVLDPAFDTTRMAAASVMVLKEVDLQLLRSLAAEGSKLGAKNISAPVVMTPDYITGSADTFPLELLEIQQRYTTLIGEDYFAGLTFEPEHMRLQCEREFKRILIRLRQGLLAAAGREQEIEALELDIGQHLLRAARGLLWLKGEMQLLQRDAVVEACERLAGSALNGLRGALDLYGQHGMREFDALYNDVEQLAKVADEA